MFARGVVDVHVFFVCVEVGSIVHEKKKTTENKDEENREGDAGLGYFQAL